MNLCLLSILTYDFAHIDYHQKLSNNVKNWLKMNIEKQL